MKNGGFPSPGAFAVARESAENEFTAAWIALVDHNRDYYANSMGLRVSIGTEAFNEWCVEARVRLARVRRAFAVLKDMGLRVTPAAGITSAKFETVLAEFAGIVGEDKDQEHDAHGAPMPHVPEGLALDDGRSGHEDGSGG